MEEPSKEAQDAIDLALHMAMVDCGTNLAKELSAELNLDAKQELNRITRTRNSIMNGNMAVVNHVQNCRLRLQNVEYIPS